MDFWLLNHLTNLYLLIEKLRPLISKVVTERCTLIAILLAIFFLFLLLVLFCISVVIASFVFFLKYLCVSLHFQVLILVSYAELVWWIQILFICLYHGKFFFFFHLCCIVLLGTVILVDIYGFLELEMHWSQAFQVSTEKLVAILMCCCCCCFDVWIFFYSSQSLFCILNA